MPQQKPQLYALPEQPPVGGAKPQLHPLPQLFALPDQQTDQKPAPVEGIIPKLLGMQTDQEKAYYRQQGQQTKFPSAQEMQQTPQYQDLQKMGQATQQPLVAPSFSPETEQKHPYATGAAKFASGLISLENLGYMGGMAATAGTSPIIERLVSAGFSLQMLHGLYQSYPAVKQAWDAQDWPRLKSLATQMGLTGVTAVLTGAHAGMGEGDAGSTKPEPTQAPEQAIRPGSRPGGSAPSGMATTTATAPVETEPTELQQIANATKPTERLKPKVAALGQPASVERGAGAGPEFTTEGTKPSVSSGQTGAKEIGGNEASSASPSPRPGSKEGTTGMAQRAPRPLDQEAQELLLKTKALGLAAKGASEQGKQALDMVQQSMSNIENRQLGLPVSQRPAEARLAKQTPAQEAAAPGSPKPEPQVQPKPQSDAPLKGSRPVEEMLRVQQLRKATRDPNYSGPERRQANLALQTVYKGTERRGAVEPTPITSAKAPAEPVETRVASPEPKVPEGQPEGLKSAPEPKRAQNDLTKQIEEFTNVIRDPKSSQEQIDVARQLRKELRARRNTLNRQELEDVLGSMKSKIREVTDRHYAESIPLEAALQDKMDRLSSTQGETLKESLPTHSGFLKRAEAAGIPKKARDAVAASAQKAYQAAREKGLSHEKALALATKTIEGMKKQTGFLRFGESKDPKVNRDALEDLTEKVRRAIPSEGTIQERTSAAEKVTERLGGLKQDASTALQTLHIMGSTALDYLKNPRPFTDFKKALGEFSFANQKNQFHLNKAIETFREHEPEKIARQGIDRYLRAGGDEAKLREWADASKDPKAKAAYEAALKLDDRQKATAAALRTYWDRKFEEGAKAGILDHAWENYVPQIYEKDSNFRRGLLSQSGNGLFNKNFKFGMRRFYDSLFDAEQNGLKAKDEGFEYFVHQYERAYSKALSTRTFAKSLFDGNATDGRPLAAVPRASARPMLPEEIREHPVISEMLKGSPKLKAQLAESFLVRPHGMSPEDAEKFGDYERIDHSAFRKYTFQYKDPESGKTIFMQGDALVHPEIAKHLKNIMGKSLFEDYWWMRGARDTAIAAKGTILGATPFFHYVQEGLHSIAHWSNPLHPDALSGKALVNAFHDPDVVQGMKHGLMLYDRDSANYFKDGFSKTLPEKIPGVGPFITKMTQHLFETYIPGLKARLFKAALRRNLERYGSDPKFSKDQIYENTALQANAAFGELNKMWQPMGSNKTVQDLARTFLLAPDFLEARLRFAGQAAKTGGREQLIAFAGRAMIGQYLMARVANQLSHGNPEWDWKHAFDLKMGDRWYSWRTISGDALHAVTDPDSFTFWRLSPPARAAVEKWATQRKGLSFTWKDLIQENLPIPLQEAWAKYAMHQTKNSDVTRGIFESIGIYTKKYETPQVEQQKQHNYEEYQKRLRGESSGALTRPPRPKRF